LQNVSIGVVGGGINFNIYGEEEMARLLTAIEGEERRGVPAADAAAQPPAGEAPAAADAEAMETE
jgi:hypothetical protein